MPFRLCNAPATFQRCIFSIFSDLIDDCVEIFMDDFSVYGANFSNCLENLSKVFDRCKEHKLVLNWEKYHFIVQEGIILGHMVSRRGIEVDKEKIEVIANLPPPKCVKDVRSFLGHVGFYRRFIRDFSKVAKPLCNMLAKEAIFEYDDACLDSFEKLKKALISAPIL